jgi:hypothetical protein
MQNLKRAEIAALTATKETRYARIAFLIVLGIWIVFTRVGELHVWLTIVCGAAGVALASFIILQSRQIGRRVGREGANDNEKASS